MKKTLNLIILLLLVLTLSGQDIKKDTLKIQDFIIKAPNNGRIAKKLLDSLLLKDTIIRLSHQRDRKSDRISAYFVNDILVNQTILSTIEPNSIEKMFIKKEEIAIGNKRYFGQVHIKLKENYIFKPICINDLKKKYLNLSNEKSIFMINNKVINEDYLDFIVNERNIYKIDVQLVENKEEDLRLNVINLITRTEENIRNAEEIRLK